MCKSIVYHLKDENRAIFNLESDLDLHYNTAQSVLAENIENVVYLLNVKDIHL